MIYCRDMKNKREEQGKPEQKVKLNPKQELFCQYYAKNELLFGNATLAYAEAYGYRLEELPREVTYSEDEKTVLEDSAYNKAYNVCSVQGSKHLRNPKIQDRVTQLLNELMRDDVVDAQLVKVIIQDHKLDAKVSAIREYNKLKQRIVEKSDLTSGGQPVQFTWSSQSPTPHGNGQIGYTTQPNDG